MSDIVITEEIVPRDQHAQLGLCPFCPYPGMSRPYVVRQLHALMDGDTETHYFVCCDECTGRGGEAAEIQWAVENWNDVSLAIMPEQTTRWPGSKLCNVKGSEERERRIRRLAEMALLATVYG